MSLENFIYKQLGDWSHGQIKKAIDNKRAFVNGRNVFISKWNLKPNDAVVFVPTQKDLPGAQGQTSRYRFVDVLFEDKYIIAVNKPAFLDYETFMQTVMNYLNRKNAGEGRAYLGAMHRLDKETSGVMVFTKKKIANDLADQFREHTIRKFYLAIVQGRVDKEQGTIKKPIEKGEFDEGKKVRVTDGSLGKMAITEFRVKERYDKASLLVVQIHTGRTHQIRIHMESIGHPLVGDKLYAEKQAVPFKRQALHAERLEFRHPVTKEKIKVLAPIPGDMKKLIDDLRGI